jgi:uncharacterized protein
MDDGFSGRAPAASGLRPVVLVTGGSSGIGLELASGFAGLGRDLLLVARNQDRLQDAANLISAGTAVKVETLACDLSQSGATALVLGTLSRASAYIDVLVNCAGTAVRGPLASSDAGRTSATLHLNVVAATELMQACLPGMMQRRRGGVLNVASLAGTMPMPNFAAYAASKSYLISLTRAVAVEAARTGVTVSVLLPGFVDTEFFARNMQAEGRATALLPALSAHTVARIGINGFLAGQTVITPGLLGNLCRLATGVLPARASARLVDFATRRPEPRTGDPQTAIPAEDANAATAR